MPVTVFNAVACAAVVVLLPAIEVVSVAVVVLLEAIESRLPPLSLAAPVGSGRVAALTGWVACQKVPVTATPAVRRV